MSDMMPSDPAPLPEVRFLKILVTALAATMILGLLAIIAIFVTRMPGKVVYPALPAGLVLPEGVRPASVSFTGTRIVVLTEDDRVLVYAASGNLLGETRIAVPAAAAPTAAAQ